MTLESKARASKVLILCGLLAGAFWLGRQWAGRPVQSVKAQSATVGVHPMAEILASSEIIDLSVTVSENLPAHWAANPPFQRWTYNWFTPIKNVYGHVTSASDGPYYAQRYVIDEHTGTQVDFPPHFIPPPESGLPFANDQGTLTGDKYPVRRLMGSAAVIDVTHLLGKAAPGKSPHITVDHIREWEREHGEIGKGTIVLFRSGYTDRYYKPFPEGRRLTFEPIVLKTSPGWPAPEPAVMDYLHSKGVMHLGTDGPSMGPAEAGAETHVAGLKYGMSWEEMLVNLDRLPPRGAFYIALPIRIVDQSGSPTRAIAWVPNGVEIPTTNRVN
ncbi:MAG: cyclase family protein [Acidobacteriota bacterium]